MLLLPCVCVCGCFQSSCCFSCWRMSQQLTLSSAASPRAASSRCRLTVSPAVTGQTFHVLHLHPARNLSGIGLKSERKITKISLLVGKPRLARMNSAQIDWQTIISRHFLMRIFHASQVQWPKLEVCSGFKRCHFCFNVFLLYWVFLVFVCFSRFFYFVFGFLSLPVIFICVSHHFCLDVFSSFVDLCACVFPRLLVPPPGPTPYPVFFVRAHHVTVSCGSCMVLMMSSTLASRR